MNVIEIEKMNPCLVCNNAHGSLDQCKSKLSDIISDPLCYKLVIISRYSTESPITSSSTRWSIFSVSENVSTSNMDM